MKKAVLYPFFVVFLAFLLTLSSWLTWNSSCGDFNKAYKRLSDGSGSAVVTGDGYTGMCAGDGMQFVGVFVFSLVVSAAFLGLILLLLRFFGLKVQIRKDK